MEKQHSKDIKIQYVDSYIILETAFILRKGADSWGDIVIDSLESALKSLDCWDDVTEMLTSNRLKVDAIIPLEILKKKLEKWGFTILEEVTQKIGLSSIVEKELQENKEIKVSKRKRVPSRFGGKTPEILGLDLKDYFKEGKTFKLMEKLIEGIPSATIDEALKKTLGYLQIRGTDKTVAYHINAFTSAFEISNRIIIRMHELFKKENRLDFLKKRRTQNIMSIYEVVYSQSEELTVGQKIQVENDEWLVVDSHRLYELVYKFGTQNNKAYFQYGKHLLFKPYRSEYILILRQDIYDACEDREIIRFNIKG